MQRLGGIVVYLLCLGALLFVPSLAVAEAPQPQGVVSFPELNVEIAQPLGCSWREVSKGMVEATRLFACAQADGQIPVTLMVEERDARLLAADQYFVPFKRGLASAAEKRGSSLASFSYQQSRHA